jgi:hypothetical protein
MNCISGCATEGPGFCDGQCQKGWAPKLLQATGKHVCFREYSKQLSRVQRVSDKRIASDARLLQILTFRFCLSICFCEQSNEVCNLCSVVSVAHDVTDSSDIVILLTEPPLVTRVKSIVTCSYVSVAIKTD